MWLIDVATPIPEKIAIELVSRLEGITEGEGYAFTTPHVSRVSLDGREWSPKHNGIIVVQKDQERQPENDYAGNPPAIAYLLPFEITGYIRTPEHQEFADWSEINDMEAAIKKAVVSIGSDWFSFVNNAFNAQWGSVAYFRTTAHTGVTVTLDVQYRVSELDPFTVR